MAFAQAMTLPTIVQGTLHNAEDSVCGLYELADTFPQ